MRIRQTTSYSFVKMLCMVGGCFEGIWMLSRCKYRIKFNYLINWLCELRGFSFSFNWCFTIECCPIERMRETLQGEKGSKLEKAFTKSLTVLSLPLWLEKLLNIWHNVNVLLLEISQSIYLGQLMRLFRWTMTRLTFAIFFIFELIEHKHINTPKQNWLLNKHMKWKIISKMI